MKLFSNDLILKKKNIIAIPNKRSSHSKKVPTAGGISFVIIGIIILFATFSSITRFVPKININT